MQMRPEARTACSGPAGSLREAAGTTELESLHLLLVPLDPLYLLGSALLTLMPPKEGMRHVSPPFQVFLLIRFTVMR